MSEWTKLLKQDAGTQIYEGTISTDASSMSDQVGVILKAFGRELDWEAPWMPRVDELGNPLMPQEGDRCVVALAETEDPGEPEVWIIGWWP